MGTAELINHQIAIRSHIITYGNAADDAITEMIRDEIESLWNEPKGVLNFDGLTMHVRFQITASFQ